MRSLWGKAPFQFQMRGLPDPDAGPGEVVVKVAACGICGTNLHFLAAFEALTNPERPGVKVVMTL